MRRPEMIVPVTFLVAIVLGTVLLVMPFASDGKVGLLEAFFTATSSVCVTGLIVVDTGVDFTRAGQAVILLLIQLGGLGIMTLSLFALVIVGRRVGLIQEEAVKEEFTAVARWRLGRLLWVVVGVTLLVEAAGAAALYAEFGSWWHATFHSVSAFCNAGFSTLSTSMQGRGAGSSLIVMALFVLGGLGFTTMLELWPRRRPGQGRRFSLHARIVFLTSGLLWLAGTALIWAAERGSFLDALFMSASTRTAGFETAPVGNMTHLTLLVMIPLMFIGASPGSTGGGIKTTTIALAYLMARSALRGHERVTVFGREIPGDLVRRMIAVMLCSALVVFLAVFFLVLFEGQRQGLFIKLVFEAVSAFGTVGLSTGITPGLTAASKVLLCVVMFVGRVGSLSLFILLVRDKGASRVRYPEERILIG